jgi:alpha-ketoglutarate-dependent dioxygenase alkB family protein 2
MAAPRKRSACELAEPTEPAEPAPDSVIRLGGDLVDARVDVWLRCVPADARLEQEVGEVSRTLAGRGRRTFRMFGKLCTMRRRQAFYALDTAAAPEYRFSGTAVAAEPDMPPLVRRCIAFANQRYGGGFNAALCNLYEDGTDYISQHADDEPAHAPGSPVLTFSFGAERRMLFTAKPSTATAMQQRRTSVALPHGSCLAMRGKDFQRCFRHGVPKAAAATAARLSVTVRKF